MSCVDVCVCVCANARDTRLCVSVQCVMNNVHYVFGIPNATRKYAQSCGMRYAGVGLLHAILLSHSTVVIRSTARISYIGYLSRVCAEYYWQLYWPKNLARRVLRKRTLPNERIYVGKNMTRRMLVFAFGYLNCHRSVWCLF